jgi:hypothetical protein
MAKLTREAAFRILNECGISKGTDFYALRFENIAALVRAAKARGYKAPRNRNGSTGRYFYEYVNRAANKKG